MMSDQPSGATTEATPWAISGSRMIFLLSSERSGSTLLRAMLGRHSRIIAPSELWLLAYADYATWRAKKPRALESVRDYFALIGRSVDGTWLDATFADRSTDEVYDHLLQETPAGSALLDKTPAYANTSETLERTRRFDPFYIWLVRHPMGVIDSHVRVHFSRHGSWSVRDVAWRVTHRIESIRTGGMTTSARDRERKWVTQNMNIATFLAPVSERRKAMVHFEDLVRRPGDIVRMVCERMGLEPEPAMLEHRPEAIPVAPGLGDMNLHRHDGIDSTTAHQWRQRIGDATLRPATRRLMETLGIGPPPVGS